MSHRNPWRVVGLTLGDRCRCSARACRRPSSARRESARSRLSGRMGGPVRRLAPCVCSCSYMKHRGPLAGRGTVARRCCCCCRRCAAAAVLRAACCCDRCCARWRVAALPLERRRDIVAVRDAARRDRAKQRHGQTRSWPCAACARHLEGVAPIFTVNFERSARPHRHGDGVTGCVGPGPAVGAENSKAAFELYSRAIARNSLPLSLAVFFLSSSVT